jgi:hypothetical protein
MRVCIYIHVCICIYIYSKSGPLRTSTGRLQAPNTLLASKKKRKKEQKASRRSAGAVRRVPRGGVGGVRHESIASDARTHTLTHSHRPFVCCQSPIVKALPSASYRSIRQRMLTYADVCCCQSSIMKALPSASYLTKPLSC